MMIGEIMKVRPLFLGLSARGDRMQKILLFALFTLGMASAQDILNNDAIVKMTKGGLGESVILSMVQSQNGKYTLTADELVKLKTQGVSDKVIAAMVAKGSAPSAVPAAGGGATNGSSTSGSAGADSDLPQNADIGAYYKKAGQWEEMLPEVVNWKTGGVIKHVATAGVVKGDVNGHVDGAHSRNSVASPLEVVIYAPEGVAITEYQLLHLHENGASREFRTVTGGVLHESGGATRDVIPFEGKRVAKGTYRVILPKMGAGEYGFLPPGASGSHSSASIGKLFTFRLVE
jgi:hypothetical protein